jgi:hypothetical protein
LAVSDPFASRSYGSSARFSISDQFASGGDGSSAGSGRLSVGVTAGIAVGAVAIVLALSVGVYLMCRRDSGRMNDDNWMSVEEAFSQVHID